MADSIVRLKVESSEYDAKLKRAAEGLSRYANECRKVGGTMEVVEKDTLDYVKAIGQMETTSNTATGKLKEMEKVFVELSVQYKNLTKEEKDSPFGKALASSLDQLKARISDSKGKIDEAKGAISGSSGLSGALDGLAGKFGMNIKSLSAWGAALGAGKIALDVAKDAFGASEQKMDEWAGVVAASESVYEGFLNAINNGDISGFLGRIDQIVKAAREAYNELDRLGTMKTIQAPAMSKQEAENNRIRMMIATGHYIAPADGRTATPGLKNGDLLSPSQIKILERQLQGGMNTIVSLTKNELDQTGKAIDAYYNKLAVQNGMSLAEFRKGTSSMAEFDKRVAGAKKYDEWQMAHSFVDQSTGRLVAPRIGNPYAQYAGWNNFRVDKQGQNSYNDLVSLIRQQQQQQSQLYSTIGQSYRTINRAEGVTVRGIMGGSGGGGGRSGGGSGKTPKQEQTELQQNQQTINTLTQEYVRLGEQTTEEAEKRREAIREEIHLLEQRNDLLKLYAENAQGRLMGGSVQTTGLAGSEFKGFASATEVKITGLSDDAKKKLAEANKDSGNQKTMAEGLSQLTGSVGSIVSGLDALGIEVPEELTAVVNTLSGISSILSGISGVVSAIETIVIAKALLAGGGIVPHAAGGYAVPGNHYSGDLTPIMANAGELVLNKAQQGNLASQLEGDRGKLRLNATLKGQDILLSLDRTLQSTGKELAVWG